MSKVQDFGKFELSPMAISPEPLVQLWKYFAQIHLNANMCKVKLSMVIAGQTVRDTCRIGLMSLFHTNSPEARLEHYKLAIIGQEN